jgi:hypothetical protein
MNPYAPLRISIKYLLKSGEVMEITHDVDMFFTQTLEEASLEDKQAFLLTTNSKFKDLMRGLLSG